MGVVINPESELGKELAKWEKPYVYVPFPRMVYKAFKRDNGRIECGNPTDEAFSRQCQLTVGSELELQRAYEQGWHPSPDAAVKHVEALERDISDAAAHRHFEDQRLSDRARAEARVADDATAEHVAAVPEAKKAPRGQKVQV